MAAAHPGSLGPAEQLEEVAAGVGVQRFNHLGFVLNCWEPFFRSLPLGNRHNALVYVSIDLQYLPGRSASLVFIYSHVSTGVAALPGKFELGRVQDPACPFSAQVLLSCPASSATPATVLVCFFL